MSSTSNNLLARGEPSICIPRTSYDLTKERVSGVFSELFGSEAIEKIDLVNRKTETGEEYKRIFVHFRYWPERHSELRGRLLEGGEFKIVYDAPKFWKCSASRVSRPELKPKMPYIDMTPSKPAESGNRSERQPIRDERPRHDDRDSRPIRDERPRYDDRDRRPIRDERPHYDDRDRRPIRSYERSGEHYDRSSERPSQFDGDRRPIRDRRTDERRVDRDYQRDYEHSQRNYDRRTSDYARSYERHRPKFVETENREQPESPRYNPTTPPTTPPRREREIVAPGAPKKKLRIEFADGVSEITDALSSASIADAPVTPAVDVTVSKQAAHDAMLERQIAEGTSDKGW